MYFNDVHILYYLLAIILGGIIGQFVEYSSKCFINKEKIFSKKSFLKYKKRMIPNYSLILIMAVLYVLLVYKFGIHEDFMQNLNLVKYLLLIPMICCAFIVDLKKE